MSTGQYVMVDWSGAVEAAAYEPSNFIGLWPAGAEDGNVSYVIRPWTNPWARRDRALRWAVQAKSHQRARLAVVIAAKWALRADSEAG